MKTSEVNAVIKLTNRSNESWLQFSLKKKRDLNLIWLVITTLQNHIRVLLQCYHNLVKHIYNITQTPMEEENKTNKRTTLFIKWNFYQEQHFVNKTQT